MTDLFPNALHVAKREYLFRVRNRAFRITTILLAIAILIVTQAPSLLALVGAGDPPKLAVAVQAEDLPSDPVATLRQVLTIAADPEPDEEGRDPDEAAQVSAVDDPEVAADQVRAGDLDGLLTITRADDGELSFEYLSDAGPLDETRLLVTQAANSMAVADRLERLGLDPQESGNLMRPANFEAIAADPDDVRREDDFGGAFILAYALVILTLMAIITYGTWVAQSVAEEKSNRVMELLITAASPRQLLTGKLLGTGAAGLTQFVVIVAAAVLGFVLNEPIAERLGVDGGTPIQLPDLEPWVIVVFAIFFVLSFLLYSTLYAAAGSMVSRVEDVQQAIGVLIFLAMAGYFASFPALNDPQAGWVAPLSLVPFFSGYLMPARILLATPTLGEIAISIALMLVAIVVATWIASRIYAAGVLLYGQRPSIRAALRAARVAR